MKKIIYLSIFVFSLLLVCQSCYHKITKSVTSDSIKVKLPEFANQGEYENYEIQQIFINQYHKESHQRYSGHIAIQNPKDSTLITFDSISLKLDFSGKESKYKKIFTTGLLTGQMLRSPWDKDTVMICCFETIENTNNLPTQRRFRFDVYWHKIMNPLVYLLEITNPNADKNTDFDLFLKKAKVTFLYNAWVQI